MARPAQTLSGVIPKVHHQGAIHLGLALEPVLVEPSAKAQRAPLPFVEELVESSGGFRLLDLGKCAEAGLTRSYYGLGRMLFQGHL